MPLAMSVDDPAYIGLIERLVRLETKLDSSIQYDNNHAIETAKNVGRIERLEKWMYLSLGASASGVGLAIKALMG